MKGRKENGMYGCVVRKKEEGIKERKEEEKEGRDGVRWGGREGRREDIPVTYELK